MMEYDGAYWSVVEHIGKRHLKIHRCLLKTRKHMEALIIMNSVLVGISIYFLKDFHTDFKEVAKKVAHLDEKVKNISQKLNKRNREL